MPVTPRLSRKFYETFGDAIANELVEWFNAVDATYRSDLRELNDLNFARFDAKLEQRFAEADAKSERRAADFIDRMREMESRLLWWMFGFWIGAVLAIAGALFALQRLGS